MTYHILFDCETCEGTGESNVRRGGVDCSGPWITDYLTNCTECEGTGETLYSISDEFYNSIDEVTLDYPTSRSIEHHC